MECSWRVFIDIMMDTLHAAVPCGSIDEVVRGIGILPINIRYRP